MDEKDKIAELFKDGLSDHSSPVDSKLWNNISSQLGHASTAAVTTKSLILKFIGFGSVALVTIGTIYLLNQETPEKHEKEVQIEKTTPEKEQTSKKIISENSNTIDSSKTENNTKVSPPIKSEKQTKEMIDEESILHVQAPDVLIVKQRKEDIDEQSETNLIIEEQQEDQITTLNNTDVKTNETPESSPFKVQLPNIFTPNNDGVNDYFELNLEGLKEISFVVMDNNGAVVYQTNQTILKWDGKTVNGDLLKEGTYVYMISGIDTKGLLFKEYSNLDIRF